MSDQRGQAPAAGGVEYAARRPIGPLVRPTPPPWATLTHVVGRRAPPDGAFYTELPNRLAAVPGSKTLSQVLNNTAICVLELAELKEVHEASMARAEAETAVALVMAERIYNRACADTPVGDQLQMTGPVDLADDAQVKAWTGLSMAQEPAVFEALLLMAPRELFKAAVAIFGRGERAADAAGPGPARDPAGFDVAGLGTALGAHITAGLAPVMKDLATAVAAQGVTVQAAIRPMADLAREKKMAADRPGPAVASGSPAGGPRARVLTTAVLDNAFTRPEVQTIIDTGMATFQELLAGTHYLCGTEKLKFSEPDAYDVVFNHMSNVPAARYLLMQNITAAMVADKGTHQARADFLKALHANLVTKIASWARDNIENFRMTDLYTKSGGAASLKSLAQSVDPNFFGTSKSEVLMGANFKGVVIKFNGFDGLAKLMSLRLELLQMAHPGSVTPKLLAAANSCHLSVKGADVNTAETVNILFHEANLRKWGQDVSAWQVESRNILADGSEELDLQPFPDLMMYYDQFNMTRSLALSHEAFASHQRTEWNRLLTVRVSASEVPARATPEQSPGGAAAGFRNGADDSVDLTGNMDGLYPIIPRDEGKQLFPGCPNFTALALAQAHYRKGAIGENDKPTCPFYAMQFSEQRHRSPFPGCSKQGKNCPGGHSLPLAPASGASKKLVQKTRQLMRSLLEQWHAENDVPRAPKGKGGGKGKPDLLYTGTDYAGSNWRGDERRRDDDRGRNDQGWDRRTRERSRSRGGRGGDQSDDGWGGTAPRSAGRGRSRDRSEPRSPPYRSSDAGEGAGRKRERSPDRERSQSRGPGGAPGSAMRRAPEERRSEHRDSNGRR